MVSFMFLAAYAWLLLELSLVVADENAVRLPACQEATRRPRKSMVCSYPPAGFLTNPANNTECTDMGLCKTLAHPLRRPRCNAPSETQNTSIYDGVVNRSLYVTYPGGCAKPSNGWPFLLFFGFDINGIRSTRSLQSEILYMMEQLLAQGVAFVETSMYWNDTYDQRECNEFELGSHVISSGTCRSCGKDAQPSCQPLRNWFTCGNWEGARDIVMMRNIFSRWNDDEVTKDLNVASMAYLGWSVGGHMVSRMIQLASQSTGFPLPRCAVMISSGTYQCYSCPSARKPTEPENDFERCNWYAQGSVANSSIDTTTQWPCGPPFAPMNSLQQNQYGVCPGHTLYPSNGTWWQMDATAQQKDDPLLTEESWDSCNKSFHEHPPVLLVQPWEDSDAYWNAAANYYEVLTRQKGAIGCRMYAGESVHGPTPVGNQGTLNFLSSHLLTPTNQGQMVV